MELQKCKDLEIGTVVWLTNPAPSYKIGEYNPVVGSEWECEGTVMFNTIGSAKVLWKNGCENGYKDNELSIKESSGKCKSIW